jgi:hypothetical protein
MAGAVACFVTEEQQQAGDAHHYSQGRKIVARKLDFGFISHIALTKT